MKNGQHRRVDPRHVEQALRYATAESKEKGDALTRLRHRLQSLPTFRDLVSLIAQSQNGHTKKH